MIKIVRTLKFELEYNRWVGDKPVRHLLATEIIYLFSKNPNDTRLKTHALKRWLRGKFAFSIDADTRIVFEWLGKNQVRFRQIGKHLQVYGKKPKTKR